MKVSLRHLMVCAGMLQLSMSQACANSEAKKNTVATMPEAKTVTLTINKTTYLTHKDEHKGSNKVSNSPVLDGIAGGQVIDQLNRLASPQALIYASATTTADAKQTTTSQTLPAHNLVTETPEHKQQQPLSTPLALPSKLTDHYKKSANPDELCPGEWVYPQDTAIASRPDGLAAQPVNSSSLAITLGEGNPIDAQAILAMADYAYYDNQRYAELSGNVQVRQRNKQVLAEKLILDTQTHMAQAEGEVFFANTSLGNSVAVSMPTESPAANPNQSKLGMGFMGVAKNLSYNTHSDMAQANDLAFVTLNNQAHGTATRLEQDGRDRLLLTGINYTTCPPQKPSWVIKADKLSLDNVSGRGEAYNAKLTFGSLPLFYLPYFNFPIDDRRMSGFLLPAAGFSTDGGLQFKLPYYINVAPNYDATLTTTLFTNRNPMASAELRYLTEQFGSGEVTLDYLPKDKRYNHQNRSAIFYNHRWQSSALPELSLKLGYNKVSDAHYFNDFDNVSYVGNQYNLPRFASINYTTDQLQARVNLETFQTVDTSVPDAKKPYTRLPDISVDYQFTDYAGWQIDTQNQLTYFKKNIADGSAVEKSGIRLYDSLNMSRPVYQPWGYITPKLALQSLYTAFDRSSTQQQGLKKGENDHASVFVPQLTLDAGLNFFKSGSPIASFNQTWATGGYQLLEPRLFYAYAPYHSQKDMPNFNSVAASLSYDQLFEANRFLGRDRLADNNFATLGINYRYIDGLGYKRLSLALADQFYFSDHNVTLNTDDNQIQQSHSGIVTKVASEIQPNLQVEVNAALQPNNRLNYSLTHVAWQPTEQSAVNLGFLKRQPNATTGQLPLSALTGSVVFPINNQWRLLAYGQYNLHQNVFQDAVLGLNYANCCYRFTLYGHRYYNDFYNRNTKPNQVIMAELNLTGLGNNASKFANLLKNKVLGFEQTNQAWYKP